MKVTPDTIRDAYAYLRKLPPFSRWGLPLPGKVVFELEKNPADHATFLDTSPPVLTVHPHLHTTLQQLHMSVAHEMVHLRQHMLGRLNPDHNGAHNTEFRRLSSLVCRHLGFNVQHF